MRNGNSISFGLDIIRIPPFLPYLWGMETCFFGFVFSNDVGSYRTYEEWKLRSTTYRSTKKHRSYRTYEEWKPGLSFEYVSYNSVLTVPMRNGNLLLPFWVLPVCLVLTVPMRNGNILPKDKKRKPPWFLPYLWGMETSRLRRLLLR